MSVDVTSIPTSSPPVSRPAGGGWLFGGATDWLLGAGLGYVISLPILAWLTQAWGLSAWPTAVFLLFSLFISGPHYGATILRVYEQRADRRRYAIFAVWITIALCGLFVAGLNFVWMGSMLVTLYATWSPWHFSGQNYGVAVMFLRRRGVPFEPLAKRFLYASFVLAFALSFLVMHGQSATLSNASVPIGELSNFQFVSMGISKEVIQFLLPIVVGAYAFVVGGTFVLLTRNARLLDLGPVACLMLVQSLWFAIPAALPVLTGKPFSGLAFTIIWISAAHGLQYLWVSYYYARGAEPSIRLPSYFARILMAGSTVTIFPSLLFAPGVLGSIPWDNGLAILLISIVNLHHFILDGAIWKLRDGKVARFLLRDGESQLAESSAREERVAWFRPAMALLGVISLAVALMDGWEREININKSGGDVDKVIAVSNRLAWIGRDTPMLHTQIGRHLAATNRPFESIEHFEKSLAMFPTTAAWAGLGNVYAGQLQWAEASDAYANAARMNPNSPALLAQLGKAYLAGGQARLARQAFERAQRLAPESAQVRADLMRAIKAETGGL